MARVPCRLVQVFTLVIAIAGLTEATVFGASATDRKLLCSSCPGGPQGSPSPQAGGAAPEIAPSLPANYSGPVTNASSGAVVPRSALTSGYPANGIIYDLPLQATSQTHYPVDRPHKHTYPDGFTLQFVAFYSSAYSGHHWAIYDQAHSFYAYDAGDVTEGDYDYDERDDLPLGCQYSDESSFNSSGALYLPSTFSAGRAPSLAPSPGTAARKHAVVIGSAANDSQAVLRILCKPMPAKTAPLQQGTATQQSNSGGGGGGSKLDGSIIFLICWFGGLGSVLVLCCVAGCLSKGGQAAGGQRGRGGGASGGDAGGGFYWADGGYGGDGGHGGHCDSGGGGCDGGGGGDGGVGGGGGD